jgi:hypothetical protein
LRAWHLTSSRSLCSAETSCRHKCDFLAWFGQPEGKRM